MINEEKKLTIYCVTFVANIVLVHKTVQNTLKSKYHFYHIILFNGVKFGELCLLNRTNVFLWFA